MLYPDCLRKELQTYDQKPTGNVEWDREVLRLCKNREQEQLRAITEVSPIIVECEKEMKKRYASMPDLSIPEVYKAHVDLLLHIANNIILAPQKRKFEVDNHNKQVLRFLIYYFNECPLAEEVFPGRGYKLHKNILLQGPVGVGKTMLMQIFAEYLKRTKNPRAFVNVSVTEMVNFYSVNNHIDPFLYNIRNNRSFQGEPLNLCLNDIGVDNRPFYGVDTLTVTNDFLHARNELWSNGVEYYRKFAHLTTNLTTEQLTDKFGHKDGYGRIVDRFKTYNIIPLTGESRR